MRLVRLRAVWKFATSRRALRLLVPILSAVPTAVLFEAAGVVKEVEEPVTRILAHRTDPPPSDVAVVRITDEDLRKEFGGKHPLAPCKVMQIVDAISALRPLAIGVDLDTSDPSYRIVAEGKCPDSRPDGATLSAAVPVVWARRVTYSQLSKIFYAEDVLGGAGNPRTAVAAVIADSDGVVRKYGRSFQTDRGELLALPIALREAAHRSVPGGTEGERLIYFYGHTSGRHRLHVSAGDVLQAGEDSEIANEFKNKMVLLGGDFQAVDEHPTPLGWMRGVEVLAHITESDPKNTPPATTTVLKIIMLAGACLIAVCFDMLNARRAVLVAVSGMLVELLASWWYTHLTRDAILVGIVFIVIVCQQIYAKIKRAYRLESAAMNPASEAAGHGAHR